MNHQQVQDIRLMYEAVYDQDLREKADEYNNMIRDEDIVEVATEYFYTYGLNSDGVDILIEKVGLDNFVEFVYDLFEDYTVLDEAKKKYVSHLARSRQEAKEKAAKAAQDRKDDENKPGSRGADTEAKAEQPKSKKPEKGGIRGAIERGMERHRLATTVASKAVQKAVPELGKGLMHGFGGTLGLIGKIASSGLKEEFEYWVNSLIEEGYDLSDYTWDDMYDIYLDEANRFEREYNVPNWDKVYDRTARDNPTPIGTSHQSVFRERTPSGEWETGNQTTKRLSKKRVEAHRAARGVKKKRGVKNEEVDLYDIILSHLLDEGYAETPEAAERIMVNMSEEWRESIVDEAYQEPRFKRKHYLQKLSKRGGMGMGTPEDPHGYRDPKMAKVGAEFSKRITAAAKAKKTGEPDSYRAEKEAQSKRR